jgi:hypothetical protein
LDAFGGPHAPPAETDLLEKLRCGVHIFLELDLLETWSPSQPPPPPQQQKQQHNTTLPTILSYSSTNMSHKLSQEDMLTSLYESNEVFEEDTKTKNDHTIRDMRNRKMNIDDFELCYVLGRGAMGKVQLSLY